MAKSNNYSKYKTKEYFVKLEYTVEYLEKLQRIFSKGKSFFLKRDLFESDGLAMNGKELIFWNVTDKTNLASHIKKYKEMKNRIHNEYIKWWVIVKEPYKEFEIYDIDQIADVV